MNLRENISRRPCRFRRSASRSFVRNVANLRLDMMVSRSGARMTETRSDVYGYNDRSELTNAVKNATLNEYAYQYDDIGNRLASLDLGDSRIYAANNLNQYTSISNTTSSTDEFQPQYDLDGNQTLVKTATGTWTVTYNGENRPVSWSCGATNIVMSFDRMGRRVEYLETTSAEESVISDGITNIVVMVTTNAHHRFVYDGYLCIQRLNAAANNAVDLAFGWDPTEPIATRPLWVQRVSGTYNFFYFHGERSPDGIRRSIEHEKLHVKAFEQLLKRIYLGLVDAFSTREFDSLSSCGKAWGASRIQALIKAYDSEWTKEKLEQFSHKGKDWDEWRSKNLPTETSREGW